MAIPNQSGIRERRHGEDEHEAQRSPFDGILRNGIFIQILFALLRNEFQAYSHTEFRIVAWTVDVPETDAVAIQEAMGYVNRSRDPHGTSSFPNRFAVDLPVAGGRIEPSAGKSDKIDGGEGGNRCCVSSY